MSDLQLQGGGRDVKAVKNKNQEGILRKQQINIRLFADTSGFCHKQKQQEHLQVPILMFFQVVQTSRHQKDEKKSKKDKFIGQKLDANINLKQAILCVH